MFDLSFAEMMVAGTVALIVLGPERLPKVARTVGEWTGKMQRLAANLKSELTTQTQWSEIHQLKQEVEDTAQQIRQDMRDIQNDVLPAWERLPEPKTPADFGIFPNEYQEYHEYHEYKKDNDIPLPLIGLKTKSIRKQSLSMKRDFRPRFRPQVKLRGRK